VAINAQWLVNNTAVTSTAAQLYTVPSSTSATYAYARDLVVTNAGSVNIFVGLSVSGTVATSVASFQIPAGGTLLLTQCQVPAGAVFSALTGAGTAAVSIGYALNVTYV
jgi:hypothetical protein